MISFFKTPDKKIRHRLIAGDLLAITASFYPALLLTMSKEGRLQPLFEMLSGLDPFARNMVVVNIVLFFTGVFLLMGMGFVLVFKAAGLYRMDKALNSKRVLVKLGLAVAISIFIAASVTHGLRRPILSPEMWLLNGGALFVILLAWRWICVSRRVAQDPYRILIVEADPQSRRAVQALASNGSAPFFHFDHMNETEFFENEQGEGRRRYHSYDMVVYPFSARFCSENMLSLIRKKFIGIAICDSLTFYKNATGGFPILDLDAKWLINLSISLTVMNRFQRRIKRMFDIAVSAVAISVSVPLMIVIAALVKLTSAGPAMFVQERLGLNEKPFRFYKFRSMYQDAEEATGPVWATKNDPRITPLGRFLRKSRLDELPQLFNVLKGEMSIVGPRPIRKFFADRLAEKFPFYYLRFYVKPGLTGWAQIMGDYGDSEEGQLKKLEYEIFYIHEYSLLLDTEILFRTVGKVFRAEGQ